MHIAGLFHLLTFVMRAPPSLLKVLLWARSTAAVIINLKHFRFIFSSDIYLGTNIDYLMIGSSFDMLRSSRPIVLLIIKGSRHSGMLIANKMLVIYV